MNKKYVFLMVFVWYMFIPIVMSVTEVTYGPYMTDYVFKSDTQFIDKSDFYYTYNPTLIKNNYSDNDYLFGNISDWYSLGASETRYYYTLRQIPSGSNSQDGPYLKGTIAPLIVIDLENFHYDMQIQGYYIPGVIDYLGNKFPNKCNAWWWKIYRYNQTAIRILSYYYYDWSAWKGVTSFWIVNTPSEDSKIVLARFQGTTQKYWNNTWNFDLMGYIYCNYELTLDSVGESSGFSFYKYEISDNYKSANLVLAGGSYLYDYWNFIPQTENSASVGMAVYFSDTYYSHYDYLRVQNIANYRITTKLPIEKITHIWFSDYYDVAPIDFEYYMSHYYGYPPIEFVNELETEKFWSLLKINITHDYERRIEIGNDVTYENYTIHAWNFTYSNTKVLWVNDKFYYTDKVLDPQKHDWGIWNWLKDGLFWIVNSFYIMIQFMYYLIVYAFNIVWGAILWSAINVLYNVVLYYMLYSILWLVWYPYVSILYVYFFLKFWLYDNFGKLMSELWNVIKEVASVVWNWLIETLLPSVGTTIITIFSIIQGIAIFVLTGGSQSLTDAIKSAYDFNSILFETIKEFIVNFLDFLPYLTLYVIYYILNIGLLYIKKIYVESRGFKNRSESLQLSINTYLLPYNVIKKGMEQIKLIWDDIPMV